MALALVEPAGERNSI